MLCDFISVRTPLFLMAIAHLSLSDQLALPVCPFMSPAKIRSSAALQQTLSKICLWPPRHSLAVRIGRNDVIGLPFGHQVQIDNPLRFPGYMTHPTPFLGLIPPLLYSLMPSSMYLAFPPGLSPPIWSPVGICYASPSYQLSLYSYL